MMEDAVAVERVPLSVTVVEYEQGDVVGLVLAVASLLPLFIGFSFGVLILVRRDLHTIVYLLGIIVNEAINFTLKHIIREPRPQRAGQTLVKYGMPSSHAQFMSFLTVYFILFLWIRVRPRASAYVPLWWSNLGRVLATVCAIAVAVIVCTSRVYLHYHTLKQVLVGAGVGVISGIAWFLVVQRVLSLTVMPWIANTTIAKMFLIRDLTAVDDCLLVEYESSINAAKPNKQKGKKRQ